MTLVQKAIPLEIRYNKEERILEVDFDDGHMFSFPAEFLRVESPSAEVQGHSFAERRFIGGKINVGITAIEPVGNYAVRICFDDNHDTGIYSWETLHDYGVRQEELWHRYLQEIKSRNISREP
ncbi:MAG: gamma-butyrobetaine hydroxylase-like domain-containing protein [Rhodospirillales bacterium]|jgi:DUF971 family protein